MAPDISAHVRAGGALLLLAAGTVGVAAPASALSCVQPGPVIADAEHVFAGRIIDSDQGRILVRVDEVWSGDPVPEQTWLRVELEGWSELARNGEIPEGLTSSVPFVFATDGAVASTGPCSMWREKHVAEHRPAVLDAPVPGESEQPAAAPGARGEGDRTLVAGVGTGAAVTALGGYWLLHRRRRLSRGATLSA